MSRGCLRYADDGFAIGSFWSASVEAATKRPHKADRHLRPARPAPGFAVRLHARADLAFQRVPPHIQEMVKNAIDAVLAAIRFDRAGLVPAVAQQHDSGEVLMLAWMNREAVAETLATGRVCYFSRSRGGLWRKGETSGQVQQLRELRVDCDGDTLLLVVEQEGVACHTGRRSCFFRAVRDGKLVEIAAPLVSPDALYAHSHPHD